VVASIAILLIPILIQDPAILQVRVVEGDGAVYPVRARATRGVTVQVTDETGKPVDGVTVSFRLPEEGPSGVFATGGRTEIALTHGDGRAGVWGMQWNGSPGAFEIRITAIKGQTRAGTVTQQFLTDSPEAGQAARVGPKRNHKWIWISLAVAGAAAGGVAAAALAGKPGAAPAPTSGLQIGTPTINLGRP